MQRGNSAQLGSRVCRRHQKEQELSCDCHRSIGTLQICSSCLQLCVVCCLEPKLEDSMVLLIVGCLRTQMYRRIVHRSFVNFAARGVRKTCYKFYIIISIEIPISELHSTIVSYGIHQPLRLAFRDFINAWLHPAAICSADVFYSMGWCFACLRFGSRSRWL